MDMLLENKVAVVYGAGGSIGGAAARAFAREGARVFLAGRTQATLDRVADDIRATGGTAGTAQLDALDEPAVDRFVDGVAEQAGRLDVSFSSVAFGDIQKPLTEISVEDFMQPITTAARSQFLTARAAARHMVPRGSGVILMFGGTGNPMPGLGGFTVALDAVEGLRRQLSADLGPHGVRVITMKTGGVPESIPADFAARDEITAGLQEMTLLGRTATLSDVGDVAAFVASDRARTMTGATVNVSCGAIIDF